MPVVCSAYGCTNRNNKTKGISYFRFPLKNKELTQQWVVRMKRDKWYPTQYSFLCSVHFEDKYMYENNDNRRLLANAVPTLFHFPSHLQTKKKERPPPRKRNHENSHEVIDEEPPAKRYHPTDDHNYSFCPSPKKLKQQLVQTTRKIKQLRQKFKATAQKAKRHKRKVLNQQEIIEGLHKRLNASGLNVLGSYFQEVIQDLIRLQANPTVHQYPQSVRKFALTINFYSAQAYYYLRKFFKLPHPRTLRHWATSIDGSPGFTEESFEKISREVRDSSEPILGTLMFDEMAIKKDLVWDNKHICGYVDLGHGYLDTEECEVAKEALVFMVTALNRSWKIPVGYCLVSGVPKDVKLNLVNQYLRKLHETGIKIVATVCDGTVTNRCVMQGLGVKFDGLNSQCCFPHPADSEEKVFVLLDAAHLIKLARNLLAEKQVLIDGSAPDQENKIEWKYLEKLVNLQEAEGLHAGNKLRRKHLEWERQKMKVSLAAQTLSNSVANALKFCRDLGLEEFSGCESTIQFVTILNLAFDLLNSCHPMGKGTKAAIRKFNKAKICADIEKCVSYLKNIKLTDGSSLYNSKKKIAINGITFDLLSVQGLAETYVWGDDSVLKYLLTRRLSQDHLELFFSCVRNRGGNRNNPNAAQFKAAYRKCLIGQIDPSCNSNVSNVNDSVLLNPDVVQTVPQQIDFTRFDHDYVTSYEALSLYSEHVVDYIAGSVVKGISKSIKCVQCLCVLQCVSTDAKCGLVKCKDVNNSLLNPSEDIRYLCKVAEKVFRSNLFTVGKNRKNIMLKYQSDVFSMLNRCLFSGHEHLFTATEPSEESHYVALIKLILQRYYSCRLHHALREKSHMLRGTQVRQTLTKIILFKGQ